MSAFACYRLPDSTSYTYVEQTEGEPLELHDYGQLNGCRGFVMAPFAASALHPVLLLRPDVVQQLPCSAAEAAGSVPHSMGEAGREAYASAFSAFHRQLCVGAFSKLVLSRSVEIRLAEAADGRALFHKACRLYPHLFIALVSTARSGEWLMATPEILAESADGTLWHTMALAGTMKSSEAAGLEPAWSAKNRAEQQFVSSYIGRRLRTFGLHVSARGPYTTTAAGLCHLRTDFMFGLQPGVGVGDVVACLHPTPAVCGIPKDAARRFILTHEGIDRRYYSGFCGPIGLQGGTHLYVSLRCMELLNHRCVLHAGGGLLPESREESEWNETEGKLQTMKHVFE